MSARPPEFLRLPRRRVAIALLTLASLLLILTPAPVAAAGLRSTSPALAQLAVQALDAVNDLDHVDDTRRDDSYVLTYNRYARLRDDAAGLAAFELGIPAAILRDAWARSDLDKQTALLAALTQLGVSYRSHRSEPGVAFDCSGLTAYAWGVAGLQLPRQSRAQLNQSRHVERADAQAGDLMYYPGHVMIYLGIDDAMVQAPYRGSEVEITFLSARHSRNVTFADPTLTD